MDKQYPGGNREFGWEIGIKDREYEYEIGTEGRNDRVYNIFRPTIGDEMDPNSSNSLSVDSRRNHSHPSGQWAQPPSSTDINNSNKIRYVWAMGNKTLYIFNNEGVLATLPFDIYKSNK